MIPDRPDTPQAIGSNRAEASPPLAKGRMPVGLWVTIGIMVLIGLGALVLLRGDDDAKDTGGGDTSVGAVDWENYAPEIRIRIDLMASEGDCVGLQREFDVAEMHDDGQRDRTGDGNADLMAYIDDKMQAAGCYD